MFIVFRQGLNFIFITATDNCMPNPCMNDAVCNSLTLKAMNVPAHLDTQELTARKVTINIIQHRLMFVQILYHFQSSLLTVIEVGTLRQHVTGYEDVKRGQAL